MKAYLPEVGQGLILAIAYFAWLLLEYAAGLHTTRIAQYGLVTNLYVLIPAIIIWRAVKHRRDVLEGGQILWWQGVTSGMIISVVSAALRAPTFLFFQKYVNPGFSQAMIEHAVQGGEKREIAEVSYHPSVLAMESALTPILVGFFLSLLITAIARAQVEKDKPQDNAAEAQ